MSVHLEIERLRFALTRTGLPNGDIQNICDAASDDIDEIILDIVSNAVSQAIDYAVDIEAHDFVDDVQVLPDSNGIYKISTHSGNLDYSKPERQMLPDLLKNAKVGESGHKYKVIPISEKESRVEQSMFSMLQARQDAIDEARAALRQRAKNRKQGIVDALKTNLSRQTSAAQTVKQLQNVKTGNIDFKTASDRQDPATSWVIPEKNADMTEFIHDLNRRISAMADEAINQLMTSYYASYTEV